MGKRLEVDLLSAEGNDFVTCLTEVVWIRPIPSGTPARFDVGLRFLDVPPRAHAMIQAIVDAAAPDPDED